MLQQGAQDLAQERRNKILNTRERIRALRVVFQGEWQEYILERLGAQIAQADLETAAQEIIPPECAADSELFGEKYLDIAKRLTVSATFAKQLRLLQPGPSRRILDLGAGGGFFCFAAMCHGHTAVALEPELDLSDEKSSIRHAAIIRLLGVPHSPQSILPQVPLVLDEAISGNGPYDLISAIAIMFNHDQSEEGRSRIYWNKDDYLFWLNDLKCQHLAQGGTVFLRFNAPLTGEDLNGAIPPTLLRYYHDLGRLLSPFIVSHDDAKGTMLRLDNADAWAAAGSVELSLPDPEELLHEHMVKLRLQAREKAKAARKAALRRQ